MSVTSNYLIKSIYFNVVNGLLKNENLLENASTQRSTIQKYAKSIPSSKTTVKVGPFSKDDNPCTELDKSVAGMVSHIEAIKQIEASLIDLDFQIDRELEQERKKKQLLIVLGVIIVIVIGIVIFFSSQNSSRYSPVGSNVSKSEVAASNMASSSGKQSTGTTSSQNQAGVVPSNNSNQTSSSKSANRDLVLGTSNEAQTAWDNQLQELEDVASEKYSEAELSTPGKKLTYTINLSGSKPLLFSNRWCAIQGETLAENKRHIQFSNLISNQKLPGHIFGYSTYKAGSGNQWMCYSQFALIKEWPSGTTVLSTRKEIDALINDGQAAYPAGVMEREFHVTVN